MIKLHFKNTKKRYEAYKAFQYVADDVMLFNKTINRLSKQDNNLPCPSRELDDKAYGIANCSELWFGKMGEGQVIDLSVKKSKTIALNTKDKNIKMLFQLQK